MRTSGKNLASAMNITKSFNENKQLNKRCIFISHISIDKSAAIAIGEYIRKAGFDIYLDIYDTELQSAVARNDDQKITESIEKGITYSTDILCLVSESTKSSWWVPYEIGFAKSQNQETNNKNNTISTLITRDVEYIPSYLKVTNLLKGTKSLNKFLQDLAHKENLIEKAYTSPSPSAPNLINNNAQNHPLDNYLNWQQ